jgi:hypothetical protein
MGRSQARLKRQDKGQMSLPAGVVRLVPHPPCVHRKLVDTDLIGMEAWWLGTEGHCLIDMWRAPDGF